MLKGIKFKTPARYSAELDRFYDLAFSSETFCASWAGRIGHYAYSEPYYQGQAATNQDGFIYLWPMPWMNQEGHYWRMSADPEVARQMCREYVEVNL